MNRPMAADPPSSSDTETKSAPTAVPPLLAKSPGTTAEEDAKHIAAGSIKPRKSLLVDAEEKVAQLGLRAPLVTGAPAYAKHSNLRKTSHALQLFGLLFFIVLLLFAALLAGLYSFYEKKIAPRLALRAPPAAAPAAPAQPSPPQAVKIEFPPEFKEQLDRSAAQITELQKQIDAMRQSQSSLEGQLKEASERAARSPAAAPVTPLQAAEDPAAAAETDTGIPALAGIAANRELVTLKERNRLTAFADKAITTGERKDLDRLIESLLDRDLAYLQDAAKAEIQRVYYHLRFTQRIEPGYKLPVNDLFKDPGIRDESDLKTEKLIELLHDQKQEWRVRLRSAWLLGGRKTREVCDALIKAIKEDPVLDVAKEAQLSLEQTMGVKFLLLAIPDIEAWWKTQTDLKSDPQTKQEAAANEAKK